MWHQKNKGGYSESTQSAAFHNLIFCQDFYHSCHMIFYMLLWSSTKLHKVPLPSLMIHDLLLTSMTFHVALASSGMIFVTPHIICVN
jgi:hypothetical protein